MNIFNVGRTVDPTHKVGAYDRESVVVLLWALGFKSVKSGYDGDAMYIFFDETEKIARIDESSINVRTLAFADIPKQLTNLSEPLEVFFTTVPEAVASYLNNEKIYLDYHKIISAKEMWSSNLASMRSAKRSGRSY